MKKILLLILSVILFAGCVSNTQTGTEDEDKNNTFTPGVNEDVNVEQNYQENITESELNINETKYENQFNNNEQNQNNNQITYCKVDVGNGLIQEYYFSNSEIKLRTSIGNEWNEVTLTFSQSCAKASDVPGQEYCSPITIEEFEQTKEGWKIGAQHMGGTCN